MSNQINGSKPLGALPKTTNNGRQRDEGVRPPRSRDVVLGDPSNPQRRHSNQDAREEPPQQSREKPRKKRWNNQQKRERKEMLRVDEPTPGADEPVEKDTNPTTIFNDPAILSIVIPQALKPMVNKSNTKSPARQISNKTGGPVAKQRGPTEENRCIPGNFAINVQALTPIQRFLMDLNSVQALEKRSLKHPKAEFMCTLCQYYCDTIAVVEKHITDQRHKDSVKEGVKRTTIEYMPAATTWQLRALTKFVEENYLKVGLSNDDCKRRQDVTVSVNSIVSRALPSCSVRLYGSSATKLGLKVSDVNLDLVVPGDQVVSKIMLAATELITSDGRFERVECNLNADWPAITFVESATKLQCSICHNNQISYDTTTLLAHYETIDKRVRPLAAMFRLWASMCQIDKAETGGWPSYAFSLMLVYYLQQLERPVLPVLHDLTVIPNPDNKPSIYLDPRELSGKWNCTNSMPLGELWLGLLRFYLHDFAMSDLVVCIQQVAPLKRSHKKWTGRKLAIEDPFLSKRNVSRSIVNMATFDYFMNCLNCSYKFFAIPQWTYGPIFVDIAKPLPVHLYQGFHVQNMLPYNEPQLKVILQTCTAFCPAGFGEMQSYGSVVVTPYYAQEMFARFNPAMLVYNPTVLTYCGDQVLPIVCCVCQQEGHLKDQCPEEELPPVEVLPKMNKDFESCLTQICVETFGSLSPTATEMTERQEIVKSIEQYLVQFYPTAQLELFGSSCNGFGLHRSDLDICFTYKDNPTGDSLNFAAIVDEMNGHLRKCKLVNSLFAITTAKVPILKFVHTESKLEGDISVYNTLAQRNTKMLRAYADIDPRVPMLGFMLKKFAKLCEICDASRGSLSSYAYILMSIYYLQRCDPPILPVLQQLSAPGTVPVPVLVEGCNTYFYEDIANLGEVWPGLNKNTTSVGLLWLQMLDFYAAQFDYKTMVITIRQSDDLPRYIKMWNTKSMAIEDPFDLTHNLGAGLSRKMHMFILKAMIKARTQFGTPMKLQGIALDGYFFNKKRICDGVPPNDRGCRICKKIGHQAKDCPQKKAGNWQSPRKSDAPSRERGRGAVGGFPRAPNGFMGFPGGAPNPAFRGPYRNQGQNQPHRGNHPNGVPNGQQQAAHMMNFNMYQQQQQTFRQHPGHLQQQRFIGPPTAMFNQDRAEMTRQAAAMATKFHLTPSRHQW